MSAVALHQGLQWEFRITLRHADSGWDHYADRWRILDPQGNILGERILYHPHEREQPFTRGLSAVIIPEGVNWIQIEAHDTVDGWAVERYKLSIEKTIFNSDLEIRFSNGCWQLCDKIANNY